MLLRDVDGELKSTSLLPQLTNVNLIAMFWGHLGVIFTKQKNKFLLCIPVPDGNKEVSCSKYPMKISNSKQRETLSKKRETKKGKKTYN